MAQSNDSSNSFKIVSPKTLSGQTAKRLLDVIGLGTVSPPIPGTNDLLITATSEQLAKAIAVLTVADHHEAYAVKSLGTSDVMTQWTSSTQLSKALGHIAITDFNVQHTHNLQGDILLDTYQGKTWLVAPKTELERMAGIITAGPMGPTPVEAEPAQSSVSSLESGRLSDTNLFKPAVTDWSSLSTAPTPFLADDSSRPRLSTTVPLNKKKEEKSHKNIYAEPVIANGEEPLNLQLKETLPITDLLALVGQYYKLDYIFDKKEVNGDVTLRLQGDYKGDLKVKHLYPLLEVALKSKNLVMTRKDNLVWIVPEEKVMEIDPELVTQGGLIEYGNVVLTRIFNLRHITTENAENLLDQMNLTLKCTTIEETGTLFVTAYAYRLRRIEEFLEMVDKPGDPKEFRYRQLKYTMAQNLTEKVQELSEQLSSVDISVAEGETSEAEIKQKAGESDAAYRARKAREIAKQRAAARKATAANKQNKDTESTLDTVYLDADERTNRILMIGHKDELDIVEDLISSLDVELQELRSLKLYRIEHLDAEEVRDKLIDLGVVQGQTSDDSTSSKRITERSTSGQTSKSRTNTIATDSSSDDASELLQDEPQVVIVESTNSLLINATPEQHLRISEIIRYVDNETELSKLPFVIYPLENQNPEDMATVLEELLQQTIEDPEDKAEATTIKKINEEIVIVPDENTFSLIVHANQRNQEWIRNLIETLDRRRPQVLIEVSLVEISKNDEFNYDLNLVEGFPDISDTANLADTMLGDTSANLVTALSDALSDSDHITGVQSNSGSGTAFYGDSHISALLTLVQEKNYGRVMAKPKILVNDNQEGTISTTDTTYVEVTGAVAGDEGAVTSTTDYEEYPTGVSLTITPHISEGDLLQLDIVMDRSDIQTSYDDRPPDTTESQVSTIVTVPDKSTIILGGLTKLNQSKGGSKIPLLGDLPLIGGLFRGVSNEDSQSHVYVFVKAEIIRPGDVMNGSSDLENISERQRMAFEQHEANFQTYQSWPGLKEQPITPKNVLDAQ